MINLLFCGNKAVFDGVYLSLKSIIKNTNDSIGVYILTMDLHNYNPKYLPINENQANYLNNIVKEINKESFVKVIDITKMFLEEMKHSKNMDNFYTPYCLLRLFADDVCELPSKILYLDTDIMAHKDISELYEVDIAGYEFAGTRDYLGKFFLDFNYINSGVLLLNLDEIRKTRLFKKARFSCLNETLAFPDQSALNKYVINKKIINSKFNSQRRLKKNTVLQHFCKSIRLLPYFHTLNIKQWDVENVHKKLKITAYDDILNEYLENKNNLASL